MTTMYIFLCDKLKVKPMPVMKHILILLSFALLSCEKKNDTDAPIEERTERLEQVSLLSNFERRFLEVSDPPSMFKMLSGVFGLENPSLSELDSLHLDSYGGKGYSFFHFGSETDKHSYVILGINSNIDEDLDFYDRSTVSVEISEGRGSWVFKWDEVRRCFVMKVSPPKRNEKGQQQEGVRQ